jgi:transcriptional regulator NrdR family protein
MKCPECGAWTVVKETRADENNSRRRRIECANMHRFTTLETVIDTKTRIRQKQKTAEISGKP